MSLRFRAPVVTRPGSHTGKTYPLPALEAGLSLWLSPSKGAHHSQVQATPGHTALLATPQ